MVPILSVTFIERKVAPPSGDIIYNLNYRRGEGGGGLAGPSGDILDRQQAGQGVFEQGGSLQRDAATSDLVQGFDLDNNGVRVGAPLLYF